MHKQYISIYQEYVRLIAQHLKIGGREIGEKGGGRGGFT